MCVYKGLFFGKLQSADFSPILTDLSGLPPALFIVGTWDPLLEDSLFMSARWQAAGNRTALKVYPGGVHVFDMFEDLTIGRESREVAAAFARECLA